MRNPWGTLEWKGDWSDKDPRWNNDLKKKLNYHPEKRNGIFWIDLKNFDDHFGSACCCRVHDDYTYKFIKIKQTQKNNISIVQIRILEKTHLYLSVVQKDKRHWKRKQEYAYSFIRYLFAKLDEKYNIVKFLNGMYRNKPSITYQAILEPGTYIVYLEVEWNQDFINEFILGNSNLKNLT